jgi:hypothetical protein
MDAETFDRLSRSLTQGRTRRGLITLLASLPLAGAFATLLGEEAAANRPGQNRRNKNQRQSGNNKDNRKGKRNDQGQNKPGPCTPNGSACRQGSDCCSNNCFNFVCAATASQCGNTTCTPTAGGCCQGMCCFSPANQCNLANLCCAPNCAGRQCGPDGCGGSGTCGSCGDGSTCNVQTGQCCKAHLQPCDSTGQCCSTDHTACAFNNVVIGKNVCCSTLGGTCTSGGPSGDCCAVSVPTGQEYAYCSPGGACGGQGAVCRVNEACLSGQCCKANPNNDSGNCSGPNGC